jgi:S-adenosylmethionine decarboxylase proenzyme
VSSSVPHVRNTFARHRDSCNRYCSVFISSPSAPTSIPNALIIAICNRHQSQHNLVTMVAKVAPKKTPAQAERPPYLVLVSQRFLVLSLVSTILVAFAVGRTARLLLIDGPQKELLAQRVLLQESVVTNMSKSSVNLPAPVLKAGKFAPQTAYTSKNFDTTLSASINSRWVVTEAGQQQCVDKQPGECAANAAAAAFKESEDQDEEEHLPAGQHLLMDIEHVEAAFLDSEERLAGAMLELVNLCGLTLLSYHCHGLKPEGVTCAGVLLESHVSFHTWPERGVITLDLFTCGPNSLLPIVPIAEKLFSIPETLSSYPDEIIHQPKMIWTHKLRGFRPDDAEGTAELTDLIHFPIGARIDYKKEVSVIMFHWAKLLVAGRYHF